MVNSISAIILYLMQNPSLVLFSKELKFCKSDNTDSIMIGFVGVL